MKYIFDLQKKPLLCLAAMSLNQLKTGEYNVLGETHENLTRTLLGSWGCFPLLLTATLCKQSVIG